MSLNQAAATKKRSRRQTRPSYRDTAVTKHDKYMGRKPYGTSKGFSVETVGKGSGQWQMAASSMGMVRVGSTVPPRAPSSQEENNSQAAAASSSGGNRQERHHGIRATNSKAGNDRQRKVKEQ
jgi:hypothetical protein